MDLPSWSHELSSDLEIINALIQSMQKITPDDDAKLQHLKKLIAEKIKNPINAGNKKVFIFTAFADTANYLYANLADDLL
jgi:ERCC4-related helicase